MSSSETSSPERMTASTSRPISLPLATSARRRSPDASTGTPRLAASAGAWVPLPAPGAPSRMATVIDVPESALADEPFVVAHHQLRLDLLHRLDDDGDHDEQAGAADGEALQRWVDDAEEHGEDRDRAEE